MGWGDCGGDSQGRPIGYHFSAKCDHEGCDATIDRGLSYACGGMHGDGEYSCEKYFCDEHLSSYETPENDIISICSSCESILRDEGMLDEDDQKIIYS
jgi:hypothetical protein